MSTSSRILPRLRLARPTSAVPREYCRRCFSRTSHANIDESWPQSTPLGEYYESILNNPIPCPFNKKPEEPPSSADPKVLPPQRKPNPSSTKTPPRTPKEKPSKPSSAPASSSDAVIPQPTPPPQSAEDKARIIFGSRLLGPAEQADRLATKEAQSTYVAGVLIPPRPEEPDNCCMSGCVNCVWDRYREDLEEWSASKAEADARLKAGGSMVDADGGGSKSNWNISTNKNKIAKDMWNEEAFQNVPVGIREFMKQEKRLKERHEREGTIGG